MTLIQGNPMTCNAFVTGLIFDVKAPRERVWRALAEEVDAWWPRDVRAGAHGSRMSLDARIGGHLVETWGSGAAILWYSVIAIDPGASIDLAGHLTPKFGGPATSLLNIAMADEGSGTRVSVSDGIYGGVPTSMARKVHTGWTMVFVKGLQKHCEAKK